MRIAHPTVDLARQMALAGWTSAGEGSGEQAIRSGHPKANMGVGMEEVEDGMYREKRSARWKKRGE